MKIRIFILLFCLLLSPFLSHAFTWVAANQADVAWDAVTTLMDGEPVPATDTIKYKVYLKDESDTISEIQETDQVQLTITFPIDGKFLVGVKAVRYRGTEWLGASAISWSDAGGVTAPDPFGITSYRKPAKPQGMRMP